MKSLRWGACVLVVGGAAAFSGCGSIGKWQTPSELENYRTLQRLYDEQNHQITTLATEKEQLSDENAWLKSTLGDKQALIEAQIKLLEGVKHDLNPTGGVDTGGDILVTNTPRGVMLTVTGDVLFSSGVAKLSSKGESVLKGVVEAAKKNPNNKLAICGFTDSTPIRRTKWGTNFNLSGARALAVLEFLESKGIPAERMHFEGYGEYLLKHDGAGHEDKARSRRVEIILLNSNEMLGDTTTPATHPTRTPRPTPKPNDPTTK